MSVLSKFLMEDVELPLVEVTALLEETGYRIDADHFRRLRSTLEAEQRQVEGHIRACPSVPAGFNPASPKQVNHLLFEQLRLPVTRKTDKGNPSADEKALLPLSGDRGPGGRLKAFLAPLKPVFGTPEAGFWHPCFR